MLKFDNHYLEKIINNLINCWENGIMKYWNDDNKATYGEFIGNTENNELANCKIQ